MSEQSNQPLHTDGSLQDYFIIETHLLSTRTADAYKGIDRSRSTPIALWKLRHPLALDSDAVRRFLGRMYEIANLEPQVSEMSSYGVDATGVAFAVFPMLDGLPLSASVSETAEAERKFISLLKIVARLHDADIVCGDLCGGSFWVGRSGDVRFIGVMGSFDAEAAATAMMPPSEAIPYLAPEQRSGGAIVSATDVFALGVLGYFLFTKTFPFGEGPAALAALPDVSSVRPVRTVNPKAPAWANDLISKALQPSPDARFRSASEMLRSIEEFRARSLEQASVPARVGGGPRVEKRGRAGDGVREYTAPSGALPTPETASGPLPPTGKKLILALGVVFGVAILVFAAVLNIKKLRHSGEQATKDNLHSELEIHRSVVGSSQLKDAIDAIAEPRVSIDEKRRQLEKIVNSDDPVAHDILVKSAREAGNSELREISEKAIIDRARRFGLMRSAEQVKQWLRMHDRGDLPSNYEAVLQSLDSTLPMEARNAKLREAYVADPNTILRLTVALALDSNNLDSYQPILAQLIGDASKIENAKNHSALALIMADQGLAAVFGDDIVQRLDQIQPEDVVWLLGILADRNDVNVRALVTSALEKKLTDASVRPYLAMIRDRGDLPTDVMRALVHGVTKTISLDDIANLGRWYDMESARVLLLFLADLTEPGMVQEAFDILSGKSVSEKPAGPLIAWVRDSHFEKRAELGPLIGKLTLPDLSDPKEIEDLLARLEPYLKERELLNVLASIENPPLQMILVQKYSAALGFGRLLNMLSSPSKDLRILVIKSLKPFNDVAALKLIIEHYEKEKDADVRAAYKETFWVIQEREEKQAQ